MNSLSNRIEQRLQEVEELFAPARAACGDSYTEQLRADEELCAQIRERFEQGSSSGKFPLLSELLSNMADKEKEMFFKTGGSGLWTRNPRGTVPKDVGLRFRQLQGLLHEQFEFEARYPEAFEILFPYLARRAERVGLSMPSFGIHVLKNDPGGRVTTQNSVSHGDAFSHTHGLQANQDSWRIEQGVWPVHLGDLQGVLLAILSREEYTERIAQHTELNSELFEGVKVPKESPIRLTDLRLGACLEPGMLKRGLVPVLDQLQRPITARTVARWKVRMLGSSLGFFIDSKHIADPLKEELAGIDQYIKEAAKHLFNDPKDTFEPGIFQTELLKKQFGDQATGFGAVSFTAAALWLFLDLDMPGVTDAKPYRLAEQVESLADIIRKLTKALNQASGKLENLVANRSAGRQPNLKGNDYLALTYYRMGYELRAIAKWLDISSYSSEEIAGTRDWKARVKQHIVNGKKTEDERYPRAAAIFANKDNPHVRRKARWAYRIYAVEAARKDGAFNSWTRLSAKIRTSSPQKQRGREIITAYVQLGSCIMQNIPPLP